MKRILSLLLCMILTLCLLPMSAFADTGGDGNLDGGGGGMGDGTSQSFWNPGMDGVRVTVINSETQRPAATPIDLTNKSPTVSQHFGKVSKIQYRNGSSLAPNTSGYVCYRPVITMPTIISSKGTPNIAAIKKYFCDEIIVRYVAQLTGVKYENLISGKFKLLLEPLAYFTYKEVKVAMTAHEAALYDNRTGGALRNAMGSLTHKNLPLAMFLEYADLGFQAYSGATNKKCSNDTITAYLGLGIVWFTDPPPAEEETEFDYEYRVNTDVITPVTVYASAEINPDDPASVTFRIGGSSYTMSNIVIPEGDSQLAWVKWHTPSTPQDITITVSTSRGTLSQTTIQAKVVDLAGNDPPDPKATDVRGSWTASAVPSRPDKTSASWYVWSAKWHPYWVWISDWDYCSHGEDGGHWVDNGWWEDQGWYDFTRYDYSASLTASMSLYPDDKSPTASGKTMGSGYGVKNTATASVYTSAPAFHHTYGQTAVSYFPEFGYGTYWRLLDRTTSGQTAKFQFAENKYSTYQRRAHFSPVWFPDGRYTVNTYVIDIWTPDGMLSANVTDYVNISDSVYGDWHIAPGK